MHTQTNMADTAVVKSDAELLKEFEDELCHLRSKCREQHKSDFEVKKAAAPFFQLRKELKEHRQRSRATLLQFLILPVMVLAVAGLMHNKIAYKFMVAAARHSIVHVSEVVTDTLYM